MLYILIIQILYVKQIFYVKKKLLKIEKTWLKFNKPIRFKKKKIEFFKYMLYKNNEK